MLDLLRGKIRLPLPVVTPLAKPGRYGILYGMDDRYGYQTALASAGKTAVVLIAGLPPDRAGPGDGIAGFERFPGNLRLNDSSKLKSLASDGTDPGVDIDELERRTGQIRGQWIDGEVTGDRRLIAATGLRPGKHYFCRLFRASSSATGEFDTPGAAQ